MFVRHFLAHVLMIRMKFIWRWSDSSSTSGYYFRTQGKQMPFYWFRQNNKGWHLDYDFIQTWYDDRYYYSRHFDTSWLSFKVTDVRQSEVFCVNYLTKFSMALDGFVGMMNFFYVIFNGKNPDLWLPWPSFEVTVVWKISCFHFLRNLAVSLDEIQSVSTTCWFVKAHAIFCAQVIYKGEKCADVIS